MNNDESMLLPRGPESEALIRLVTYITQSYYAKGARDAQNS
jgi:hypothetical protein